MATPQQRERLGKRVIRARKAKGWNQRQLAEAAGLDQAIVSRVENGSREASLPTLHRLRDALTLDDDAWIGWLDAIKPESKAGAA